MRAQHVNAAQVIRIGCLLAVIFAAGVFTGRLTVPRPPILVPDPRGQLTTPEMVLARMTAEVGLDAGQQERLRPHVERAARQMARWPAATPERLAIFREMVPHLRAVLRPEQHARFDRYVRATEVRFERAIQRRAKREAP